MTHCSEAQLERLVNQSAGWLERVGCAVHMLFCAQCRLKREKIREDLRFLQEFRQGVLVMEEAWRMARNMENPDACMDRKSTKEVCECSELAE